MAIRQRQTYERTLIAMDTAISVRVVADEPEDAINQALDRCADWFRQVEQCCNRFDDGSELSRLCRRIGTPVQVSPLLAQALAFALHVAELTGGAFDPAVGAVQVARGFDRNYRTGTRIARNASASGTYKDVRLDLARSTAELTRPLMLDLGAIAKGLAIDLAARELARFERFAVDAGGDLFAGGAASPPCEWQVGVRDPREPARTLTVLPIWNRAVCTSAGYERPAAIAGEHHIVAAQTGESPRDVIGVTVIAPTALAADALSTAAFVLGPVAGLDLLTRGRVEGLLVLADGGCVATRGLQHLLPSIR